MVFQSDVLKINYKVKNMKKIFILILGITLAYSCSKNETNNQTGANSSTVNVRWEIIASSNVRTDPFVSNSSLITITYTNSVGQQQIETTNYTNDFISWNKTFNLTNTNRPLNLSLKMTTQSQIPYIFYIRNGGTIKFNLYLDGVLTKSVTETTNSNSSYQQIGADRWYEIPVFNFPYTIQ
jgi:hypothetical protein